MSADPKGGLVSPTVSQSLADAGFVTLDADLTDYTIESFDNLKLYGKHPMLLRREWRLSLRDHRYGDSSVVTRMQEYGPQYYLGQLEIQKDETQVLRRAKWKAIATTAPELVDPLLRWVGNPATGEPTLMQPHMLPPDDRAVRIGDKFIGSFRWSFYEYDPESNDDLGVVLIYAVPGQEEAIRSMAERFATKMNACFGVDQYLIQWAGRQNQEVTKPSDAVQPRNEAF